MRGRSSENVFAIPKVAFTGLTKQMILKITNNSSDLMQLNQMVHMGASKSPGRWVKGKEQSNILYHQPVLCSRGRNTTSDPALW